MVRQNTRRLATNMVKRVARAGAKADVAARMEEVQRSGIDPFTASWQEGYSNAFSYEQPGQNQPAQTTIGPAPTQTDQSGNQFGVPGSGITFTGPPLLAPEWDGGPSARRDPYQITVAPQRVGEAAARTDADGRQGFGSRTAGTGGRTDFAEQIEQARMDAFGYAEIMDMAEQEIDELNRERLAAITAGANELAADYDKEIARVQKRYDDAKVGMQQAMAAYRSYQEQAQIISTGAIEAATAGKAAMAEAMEGRAEGVVDAIDQGYAASVEDIEEIAAVSGLGNAALGPGLENAVRIFEDMFADAARHDIESIDRIATAGADFAAKTAAAVAANDAYMTENEREQLEIKLQADLDALAENIAQLQEDKKIAVQRAMDQYDPLTGFDDPAEAWSFVLENYAALQGWDLDELDAVNHYFSQLKSAGITTRAGAAKWVGEQVLETNYDNVLDYVDRLFPDRFRVKSGSAAGPGAPVPAEAGDKLPPEVGRLIEVIAAGPRSPDGAMAMQRLRTQWGVEFDIDEIDFADKSDYDNLLDVVDMWEDHNESWKNRQSFVAKKGRSAPQNAANVNHPAYVERRTVTVPNFVDDYMARFHPGASRKKYVGGEGYIRPVTDVGGGKAANSDHQSGGAVDLYADTEAERKAIERWANSRPDVSYVIYSGNKAHEGHHVHVSLLLNYNPSGDQRSE